MENEMITQSDIMPKTENTVTRTGFTAIVGRPNVGKSTLLNSLIGEKIAIVSKKPQTTRNRITGILTKGDTQFVFMDTPGMHSPKTKLGKYMVKSISGTLDCVDAAILVVDPGYAPGDIEISLMKKFKSLDIPAILVINKTDIATPVQIGDCIRAYSADFDFASVVPISALKNDGTQIVLDEVSKLLHEGEWMFSEDELTDQSERKIVTEIIREKMLRLLDNEIPHGCAVVIEEFKEKKALLSIRAEIYCERESHKRIIIGKNGEMLKKIGTYAREDIEKFFDIKVFLDLWVKVKENWRESEVLVSSFGYKKDTLE